MAQFAYDSFTFSSGAVVTSRSGEQGASWTQHANAAGQWTNAGGERIYPSQSGVLYMSGVPGSADYYVETSGYVVQSDVGATGIAGRIQTNALTLYYAYWSAGEWVLARYNAGVITGLDSFAESVSFGVNYVLRLDMVGAIIRVLRNGTQIISVNDALNGNNITAAGRAGIRSNGVASSSTGKHLRDIVAVDTTVVAKTQQILSLY